MTPETAAKFAAEWIEAWNSHDLDRILSHYADNIVLLSPYALKLAGTGRVDGMSALRSYWAGALDGQPGLHFELVTVLTGHDCLTIHYRNHRGQQAAEAFEFDRLGKVIRSFACYA